MNASRRYIHPGVSVMVFGWFVAVTCMGVAAFEPADHEASIAVAVESVLAVDRGGAGHAAATAAWPRLTQATPDEIPLLLVALDRANPLATNWIRAAVDTAAERLLHEGERLPADALEAFLLDTSHAPRARRLAYEWLFRMDSTAAERLTPRMLDDPSAELRRDAVEWLIRQTEDRFTSSGDLAARIDGLATALAKARDRDQIESLIERLNDLGHAVDQPSLFGYVTRWSVIGPFDNTEQRGWDTRFPPELRVDLQAAYEGKHGPVAWTDYQSAHPRGLVDLNAVVGKEKSVVAYAFREFDCPEDGNAEIRSQSFNALKIWFNGEEVAAYPIYHGGSAFDQYVAPIRLRKGRNTILLKICQNDQPQSWAEVWGFQLRVTDALGGPIERSEPRQ